MPRANLFSAALLEDNANAYEPTLKLEMARPLLLTGPALYKLKEPYAAISAAEVVPKKQQTNERRTPFFFV